MAREVTLDQNDDRDPKAVMWARMANAGELGLPMAYQSAKIIDEQVDDEDDGAIVTGDTWLNMDYGL